MSRKLLTALLCLAALLVELAFDSSTAFVRAGISATRTSFSGSGQAPSMPNSDTQDNSGTYDSGSHASGPVLDASVMAPLDSTSSFEQVYLLVTEDGYLFVPLRPPIRPLQPITLA